MSKKSIRFFNDREVRAVWDEDHNKWWFSATDIVRAINDEEDYVKAGNYWRWLKKKLNIDTIQLVSITHDFKFEAPDGKQRKADALDAEGVQTLATHYPNNRALSRRMCLPLLSGKRMQTTRLSWSIRLRNTSWKPCQR